MVSLALLYSFKFSNSIASSELVGSTGKFEPVGSLRYDLT
jgi:hypothetical protein